MTAWRPRLLTPFSCCSSIRDLRRWLNRVEWGFLVSLFIMRIFPQILLGFYTNTYYLSTYLSGTHGLVRLFGLGVEGGKESFSYGCLSSVSRSLVFLYRCFAFLLLSVSRQGLYSLLLNSEKKGEAE